MAPLYSNMCFIIGIRIAVTLSSVVLYIFYYLPSFIIHNVNTHISSLLLQPYMGVYHLNNCAPSFLLSPETMHLLTYLLTYTRITIRIKCPLTTFFLVSFRDSYALSSSSDYFLLLLYCSIRCTIWRCIMFCDFVNTDALAQKPNHQNRHHIAAYFNIVSFNYYHRFSCLFRDPL